jgi:hypothetical protein
MFLNRKLQQAVHSFITRLQYDGESALAMGLVKQLGLHCGSSKASSTAALEVLHCALMLLRLGPSCERAEVSTPAGLGINSAGIKPILARLQLLDHIFISCRGAIIDPLDAVMLGTVRAAIHFSFGLDAVAHDPAIAV